MKKKCVVWLLLNNYRLGTRCLQYVTLTFDLYGRENSSWTSLVASLVIVVLDILVLSCRLYRQTDRQTDAQTNKDERSSPATIVGVSK